MLDRSLPSVEMTWHIEDILLGGHLRDYTTEPLKVSAYPVRLPGLEDGGAANIAAVAAEGRVA